MLSGSYQVAARFDFSGALCFVIRTRGVFSPEEWLKKSPKTYRRSESNTGSKFGVRFKGIGLARTYYHGLLGFGYIGQADSDQEQS